MRRNYPDCWLLSTFVCVCVLAPFLLSHNSASNCLGQVQVSMTEFANPGQCSWIKPKIPQNHTPSHKDWNVDMVGISFDNFIFSAIPFNNPVSWEFEWSVSKAFFLPMTVVHAVQCLNCSTKLNLLWQKYFHQVSQQWHSILVLSVSDIYIWLKESMPGDH